MIEREQHVARYRAGAEQVAVIEVLQLGIERVACRQPS